jgi:predicted transcriptional regulator
MTERKNNRGKIEIMADVLSLCTTGIKKTHIMYKANLSYEQILYYLKLLSVRRLIIQDVRDGAILYRTTERGRDFLGYYFRMEELLREHDRNAPKIPVLTI